MGKIEYNLSTTGAPLNEVRLHPQQTGISIAAFENMDDIPSFKLPAKLQVLLSVVCVKGAIKATIDLEERVMHERDLMVLRPGHVVTDYSTSADFKGFFTVISPEVLGSTIPAFSHMRPCVFHFMNNPIINLSESEIESQADMHALLQKKIHSEEYPYKGEVIRTLCEAIFYETLSLYTMHMKEGAPMLKRKDDILYKFISIVERDFRKSRSVTYYANKLCVTPKHLSSVVKETSGRTAGEWIDAYVIIEAKNLLKTTGMTIQEIASDLNFANQSFFGKYFKHLTGMSPRDFRTTTNS